MKKILLLLLLILFKISNSQQLKATVDINYSQIGISNKLIFEKLKKSLLEYINNNNFIDEKYTEIQKIDCDFFILINNISSDGNYFSGTLQIQSYRPVYNTDYNTPIFTCVDNNFNFSYSQDEPLIYNPFTFNSNLLSIIDYYCYLIIGMDQDTFSLYGGDDTFAKANKLIDLAISAGLNEWLLSENNSRSIMLDHILNNNFKIFRNSIYFYHIKGIDILYSEDKNKAKLNIITAMNNILDIYEIQQRSALLDNFILSKYKEINSILTDNDKVENQDIFIKKMSNYSSNFAAIRYK